MSVEAAARALIGKLDLIGRNESYRGVLLMALAHGYAYTGPNYTEELEALRRELQHPRSDDPISDPRDE
jgi:hypothetical protein